MTHYTCWFNMPTLLAAGPSHTLLKAVDDRGISAFKDGFWVRRDGAYSQYEQSTHSDLWIPPHAIQFISKKNAPA